MYRNFLLVLLTIILWSFEGIAQTVYFAPGVSFGFWNYRSGESLSNSIRTRKGSLIRPSYTLGVEFQKQKNFSLSSEIYYYGSGAFVTENEQKEMRFGGRLYFLNEFLSVGSNINFYPINKKFSLQLHVGPRFDLLTKIDSLLTVNPNSEKEFRKYNYGVTAGAGIYYNFKKYRFGLTSNYFQRFYRIEVPNFRIGTSNFKSIELSDQALLINLSLGYNFSKN